MPHSIAEIDDPDDCLEAHLARRSGRGGMIYPFVLFLLLSGLAALPLVRVELTVPAQGVIRPAAERHEILAPAAGRVAWSGIRLHDRVASGEVLLRLEGGATQDVLRETEARLAAVEESMRDLEWLLAGGGAAETGLLPRTPLYQHAHERYLVEVESARARAQRSAAEAARSEALAERGLVARADADRGRADADADAAEIERIEVSHRQDWAQALTSARGPRSDLAERRERLLEEIAFQTVRAPVRGTVEAAASIAPGSFVRAGDRLAVLSPDTVLFAEVFVEPRDIAALTPGLPARLLIDAFNYNDWGTLPGRVVSIAGDYTLVDQRPLFRVAVELESTEFELSGGAKGRISKGMTLQARFRVAERTIWQLLRDDVHDRLNPIHHQRGQGAA